MKTQVGQIYESVLLSTFKRYKMHVKFYLETVSSFYVPILQPVFCPPYHEYQSRQVL